MKKSTTPWHRNPWRTEIRKEPLEDQVSHRYYTLEDAEIATATAAENNNFENVSTAGSMTRFLPIENYLYTINFNELVLFSLVKIIVLPALRA